MRITVDASELGDIIDPGKLAATEGLLRAVVEKTAATVEAGAKARSRVDTGAMRAGWEHTVEGGGDAIYGDVTNGVDYAIHNEFGTWKMAAQPMAIPALDQATPSFIAAVEKVVGDL